MHNDQRPRVERRPAETLGDQSLTSDFDVEGAEFATPAHQSVLDDPAMAGDLAALESNLPARSQSAGPLLQAEIDALDRGLALSRSAGANAPFSPVGPEAQTAEPDAAPAPEPTNLSPWRLPLVALWLFLMLLGAGAATWVFQARVSAIVGW